MDLSFVISSLVFIFPSYVANASPVLVRKIFSKTHPVDMGLRFFDGRRILGDGKTLEGVIIGLSTGTIIGLMMSLFSLHTIKGSFILSLGTVLGDMIGSFIKRRLGVKRGEPLFLGDQLLFLVFSLVLYSIIIMPLPPAQTLFLIVITPPLHLLTNYIAFKLGLKDVPW